MILENCNFLVIELERFIFPNIMTKQFSNYPININQIIILEFILLFKS